MKKRLPTREELKLWRESNQYTERIMTDDDEDALDDEEMLATEQPAAAPLPAPLTNKRSATPPPLKLQSPREASRNFKPHAAVEATLDLHGLTKLEAHARVAGFIAHQQRLGRRHVIIITGKGRGGEVGVLRSHVPHWLNEAPVRPLISAIAYAKPEKGGAGVLHVLLKRAA